MKFISPLSVECYERSVWLNKRRSIGRSESVHQRTIFGPPRRAPVGFFLVHVSRSGGETRAIASHASVGGVSRERVLRTETKLLGGESDSRRSGAGGGHRRRTVRASLKKKE